MFGLFCVFNTYLECFIRPASFSLQYKKRNSKLFNLMWNSLNNFRIKKLSDTSKEMREKKTGGKNLEHEVFYS